MIRVPLHYSDAEMMPSVCKTLRTSHPCEGLLSCATWESKYKYAIGKAETTSMSYVNCNVGELLQYSREVKWCGRFTNRPLAPASSSRETENNPANLSARLFFCLFYLCDNKLYLSFGGTGLFYLIQIRLNVRT